MKNYIQPGEVVAVPAPATVASGAGVQVGTLFGVAGFDAASGAKVEIHTRGAFELVKVGSQAWTVGVAIYWDDAAKKCTTAAAAGANLPIGNALVAVGSGAGETLGIVRLNG